jgi:hypothetical protein
MSTLVTIHLDGHLGADNGAHGTASALAVLDIDGVLIACGVQLIGKLDALFGAEIDAQLAAFAYCVRDFDSTFHYADMTLRRICK